MSRHEWALCEYAIEMSSEDVYNIARLYGYQGDDDFTPDQLNFLLTQHNLEVVELSNFVGEVYYIKEDGSYGDYYLMSYDDYMYYLPLPQPTIFKAPFKTLGGVEAYVKKMTKLPKGFEVPKHLVYLSGIVYG